MIGAYKVFGVSIDTTWDFDGFSGEATTRRAESVEAAKAAAQADYRARILAALHPSPDALQAVTAAVLEDIVGLRDGIARMIGALPGSSIDAALCCYADIIANLRPDASEALARRDAQMTAKGRKDGLAEARKACVEHSDSARRNMAAARDIGDVVAHNTWSAIVSHLDIHADALTRALAAQTEEAANG
jgi:hypothetical protein